MRQEQQEVADLIRKGQYFREARAWYAVLCVDVVFERALFLLIALLAGAVALVSVVALFRFLPLTERPQIIIAGQQQQRPVLLRMRPTGKPLERATEEFLLREYIASRERYAATDFERSRLFVQAHSDAPTFAAYDAVYGRANPRSPAQILGEKGRRLVKVEQVSMQTEGDHKQAVVEFSTELAGVSAQAKTQWTAQLSYYYSPFTQTEGVDENGRSTTLVIEDPQLKVVSYVVNKTP